MTFIRVLHSRKWPVVLPMYDGRRCPDCCAVVIGKHGQKDHWAQHEEMYAWRQEVEERLHALDGLLPGGAVPGMAGYVVASALDVGPQPDYAEGEDGG